MGDQSRVGRGCRSYKYCKISEAEKLGLQYMPLGQKIELVTIGADATGNVWCLWKTKVIYTLYSTVLSTHIPFSHDRLSFYAEIPVTFGTV